MSTYAQRQAYLRPYQSAYKRKRRQEYVDKRGGVCEGRVGPDNAWQCGSSLDLEFHHREPHLKMYSGNGFFSLSRVRIEHELAKCDLLCRTCHAKTPSFCRPITPVPRRPCLV